MASVREQRQQQHHAMDNSSDDDDEQEGEWEEWGNGGGDDEDEDNVQTLCLFCEETLASPETVFKHCVEQHAFDFSKLRAASHLSLYDCLCLINFIRSRVSMDVCWNCGSKYDTRKALLEHLNAVKHTVLPEVTNGTPSWSDEKYLTPFLENDPLLYSCEGDDDEQSEDFDVVDKDKAVRELLEFSSMNKQSIANVVEMAAKDETSVQGLRLGDSNLADLTKVFLALGDGFWDESTSPTGASVLSNKGIPASSAEIISGVVGDVPALESDAEGENSLSIKEAVVMKKDNKDKKLRVSFAKVAEREMRNANRDYFGSYSAFGIHREMLSDRVRTDAYRDSILKNPALFKDAVVMDVGCGTGILRFLDITTAIKIMRTKSSEKANALLGLSACTGWGALAWSLRIWMFRSWLNCSLFAAQAGALKVIAVDGSTKMASVAQQIAKANGYLKEAGEGKEESRASGVMTVVTGMIEDLDSTMPAPVQGVDVLISEWMGYCLLFESMLPSVLHARDRWLKPGGAILPDTAHMYVAGFGKGGTSLPFWEDVYGFDMQFVGQEVVHDATQMPIIDVVDHKDVVTNSCLVQSFDLVTMKTEDVDFTSEFHLELPSEKDRSGVGENNIMTPESANIVCCYGLVVWFDTGFTDRFCREQPVLLSTSPHNPKTHWSQTLLTFREPIALTHSLMDFSKKADIAKIGSESLPAVALNGRLSIARSSRHRSIDISVEISAILKDGLKRTWPVQMFDI